MISSDSALLELSGISKQYGDTVVLTDGSLSVRKGEIHSLLGGNGAGKSTLVRIIAGLVQPNSGSMLLDGAIYSPHNKRDAEAKGIEIVQQEFNLISTLTVAENLLLTRLPNTLGKIHGRQLRERATKALARLQLQNIDPNTLVGSLGVGQQQMIEIAAALDRSCRVLILDEPTAALSAAESETLFQWLDRLRSDGVGILYISHRLDEVARLSDQITFLRDGKSIGTFEAKSLTVDDMLQKMTGEEIKLVGEASSKDFGKEVAGIEKLESGVSISPTKPAAMRVVGLTGGPVKGVSFEVAPGEKLGIAGLVGSGRTELLRLIFGADRATEGALYLHSDSKAQMFRHPSEAVAAGIAMVTEDRKRNGLLLSQSISVNSSLASLAKRFSKFGLILSRKERDSASEKCRELETRCTGIDQLAGTLSGGNQQKVVLAKWLSTSANVFLLDEPTRGIDIPARKRIYRLIESLSQAQKSIVMVSSDIEELFEVCDRIVVMSNGEIVESFLRHQFSYEEIMRASFAGYRDRSLTS